MYFLYIYLYLFIPLFKQLKSSPSQFYNVISNTGVNIRDIFANSLINSLRKFIDLYAS